MLELMQPLKVDWAGQWAVIYLTKSSDTFMGSAQFEKFYWKYLRRMIEEIIADGMIPYIYTEGPYNSRLEYLKDVPPGVIYHFEDTVNMKQAKKVLGQTACISGGFPISLLPAYHSRRYLYDVSRNMPYVLRERTAYGEALRILAGHISDEGLTPAAYTALLLTAYRDKKHPHLIQLIRRGSLRLPLLSRAQAAFSVQPFSFTTICPAFTCSSSDTYSRSTSPAAVERILVSIFIASIMATG